MEFQRWNASQTLYASEQAQKIFDIMEFLSNNRECDGGYFPSLRPKTYSYESVISCWSVSLRKSRCCVLDKKYVSFEWVKLVE
jgi:hypothetical protein